MDQTFYLVRDEMAQIQNRLRDRSKVQELIKNFVYDDGRSMNENLNVLSKNLIHLFQLSDKPSKSITGYLQEKNIPIEVNFKPLRYEQLVLIVEEWISHCTEISGGIEKLYTNNHRNILFKRILFEEKEAIDAHFSALSEEKMLKGVDLYQLLVDIVANYFLYEYNEESQTFFQKVNSFQTFQGIVSRFVNSDKRIIYSHDKIQYVRRYEFERLIQYWQYENEQLTLLSQRRKNIQDAEVQTKLINITDLGSQTERESFNLESCINQMLLQINRLTAITDNKKQLEIIDRLYVCLRREKIQILKKQQIQQFDHTIDIREEDILSDKTQKNSPKFQSIKVTSFDNLVEKDKNEANRNYVEVKKERSPYRRNQKAISQNITLSLPNGSILEKRKLKQTLTQIYNQYKNSSVGCLFDYNQLKSLLEDLGVIEKGQSLILQNLLKEKYIVKANIITLDQFYQIIEYIMKEDTQLTTLVLDQFLRIKRQNNRKMALTSSSTQPLSYLGNYNLNHTSHSYLQFQNKNKYFITKCHISDLDRGHLSSGRKRYG